MYTRCASLETGWLIEEVEAAVKAGNIEYIDSTLNASLNHVRWCFDSSPSYDDIQEELEAFAITHGEWPVLIVVDNIRNVFAPDAGEDVDAVCQWLKEVAAHTGAAVIGLHHVKGAFNDGNVPIPLSGLIGQIGKIPELILTLHRVGSDVGGWSLRISPVKNRTGRADASGAWWIPHDYHPERMLIL